MDVKAILSSYNLDSYVKDIIVLESENQKKKSTLPFFADGYPGVMFQQSKNGAFLQPKNKALSEFFLYGQTLDPIEISIQGAYRMIVFQLFPSSAKKLFRVNPKMLNDDCYDLNRMEYSPVVATAHQLLQTKEADQQVEIICSFLAALIQETGHHEQKVKLAVNLILESKGKISMKALREQLYMTERTLQRQFIAYVGIPPKQLAKIIQFQSSLDQISEETFSKLTEVVFENGYADQSHFIRSFKKFTGKKPSTFKIIK